MTETYVLNARTREKLGSTESKRIRSNNEVPAVIYNKGGENEYVVLSAREFETEYTKGDIKTRIAEIKTGDKTIKALVHEVETHPVSDRPIHVDFVKVEEGKDVKVKVRINYTNKEKSPGIKRGGFLNKINRSIEVVCSADNIPATVELNVESAHIGDKIEATAIKLPEGVKLASAKKAIVASITGRGKSKEEGEAAEGEGAEGAEA